VGLRNLLEAALGLLLLTTALPARGTVADNVCAGDPCVIAGTHAITHLSTLDFGTRDVVLDGTLDVGTGQMTILAGSYTQNGDVRAQGGASGFGGGVTIQTTGDLTINSTAGDSFRMNGLDGGSLELTSTLGSVTVDGAVDLGGGFIGFGGQFDVSAAGSASVADADLGATEGGFFALIAGGPVTLGNVDVSGGVPDGGAGEVLVTSAGDIDVVGTVDGRGGLNGFGALVTLDAAGVVRVPGTIDVLTPGGDGGEIELIANTCSVTGSLTADGGAAGGQILITTTALAELLGTITSDGTNGNADGGEITVATTGALLLGGTLSTTSGSQGFSSLVDLSACTVDSQAGLSVEALGVGGAISVAAGALMTLQGSFDADTQVSLTYGLILFPPDISGATFPGVPIQTHNPLIQCLPADCGNGTVEPGEQCDDSGESAFCNADCSFASCGDLTVNFAAGETCDEGGETATCDSDCSGVVCSDGVVNEAAGEGCDDGDLVPGDGCDGSCLVEGGYGCVGEPSVCTILGAGCPLVPSPVCSESAKNITLFLDKQFAADAHPTTGSKAKLVFKWVKGSAQGGAAVQQSDFGTPGQTAPGGDVRLCFYENDVVQFSLTAPQDGPWAEIKGKGWKYIDKKGELDSNEGVEVVVLKANDVGKASIVILAKGVDVPVPALPRVEGGFPKNGSLDRSYDVQVHIDDQLACHGMSYGVGTMPDVHADKARGDGSPVGVWKIKRTGP